MPEQNDVQLVQENARLTRQHAIEKLRRLVSLEPVSHKLVEQLLVEQRGEHVAVVNNRRCRCGQQCLDECFNNYEHSIIFLGQVIVLSGLFVLSEKISEPLAIIDSNFIIMGAITGVVMKSSKLMHELYKQQAASALIREIESKMAIAGLQPPAPEASAVKTPFAGRKYQLLVSAIIGCVWIAAATAAVNALAQMARANSCNDQTIPNYSPLIVGGTGLFVMAVIDNRIRAYGAERTKAINKALKQLQKHVEDRLHNFDMSEAIQVAQAADVPGVDVPGLGAQDPAVQAADVQAADVQDTGVQDAGVQVTVTVAVATDEEDQEGFISGAIPDEDVPGDGAPVGNLASVLYKRPGRGSGAGFNHGWG